MFVLALELSLWTVENRNMRVSKWGLNIHFWLNFSFKLMNESNEWMNQINEWTNEWIKWVNEWMNPINGWIKWVNEWINVWMNVWLNEWNEMLNKCVCLSVCLSWRISGCIKDHEGYNHVTYIERWPLLDGQNLPELECKRQ